MTTIIVEKRSGDYRAYLNGDKRHWDCGKTPAEAIGSLILHNARRDQETDEKANSHFGFSDVRFILPLDSRADTK